MTLIPMCLCFLVRESSGHREVLLGRKKLGFGAGRIVGLGGHVDPGEDAVTAAVREVWEESGLTVDPLRVRQMASVVFHFPAQPSWDQDVEVFIGTQWRGEVTPSDEIAPEWHAIADLPFDQMWDDARYWLPQVLDGDRLKATFRFDASNALVEAADVEVLAGP